MSATVLPEEGPAGEAVAAQSLEQTPGGEAAAEKALADEAVVGDEIGVEAVAPVEKPALHERVRALLDLYLADNRQAWTLSADGVWRQRAPDGVERASHALLLTNSWGIVEGAVGSGLWDVTDLRPETPSAAEGRKTSAA